ncbi:MAG: hypothetical protein KA712_05985 [Myxococcales bacterium]|nr:hypothetical protein [Myxococcales bacterium]
MTDLRSLLDLPVRVQKSQFVVDLNKSIGEPDSIVQNYAVTSQIHDAYDRALGFVQTAITDRQNVASYLHGSFGSGKSHFMAMLSLMLGNHPGVWSTPELHDLRVKHEWIKQRKILRLHFNMIGAESLEAQIFGGYVKYVRENHPEATLPPLFEDAHLFTDAARMRQTLGDDAFFAKLNESQPAAATSSGWGKRKAALGWDAERFAHTISSDDPLERAKLVTALTNTLFTAFAKDRRDGYVSFDKGLAAMCQHAKAELGADCLVLFLDELILWLGSIAANRARMTSEVPKLSKLVERQEQGDGVPVVSFVARQRDISEIVSEEYIGPEHSHLRDALAFWHGRFNEITLGDANLPEIVEKRVVRPKDEDARKRLNEAFSRLRSELGTGNPWGTLLGKEGTEAAFRRVYPFSPVLIETLIALSHLLQRERTALKVLMELLVEHIPEHMPDFQLGQVVPVGELYDVLAAGEEPMDGKHREMFRQAKRVYQHELLPVIQAHGSGNPRADQRLIKTLILAALVPRVDSLKDLTVSRLVQLNHGSIKTIIPGGEVQQAASRLREWAASVHNLRVGEGADPSVTLVLDDIDTSQIIKDAESTYNTEGAKRAKLQEILYKALGLDEDAGGELEHKLIWRGSRRVGSLIYGNVREMDDVLFQVPPHHDFRVILDYPFDKDGHGPDEDRAKIAALQEAGKSEPVIIWVPSFFGDKIMKALGELVTIDRILEPLNFKGHVANLRPDDQTRTRQALEHLRNQKHAMVRAALSVAYGLRTQDSGGYLDEVRSIDQHFFSLYPNCRLRTPAQTEFGKAVETAVGEMMESRYPRHPRFEPHDRPVTAARLEKAFEAFERVCGNRERRVPIDRNDLPDYALSASLGLLDLSEATATLSPRFTQEIDKRLRAEGIDTPTVDQVKRFFDPERVQGLLPEVADFVVRCFALATHREIWSAGRPQTELKLGKLGRDWELVQSKLPSQSEWDAAAALAGSLFGFSVGKALNVNNLRDLSERLNKAVRKALDDKAERIAGLLAARCQALPGADAAAQGPRLKTAEDVGRLLGALATQDPVAQAKVLASFQPQTSPKAMQRHLLAAAGTMRALQDDVAFNALGALDPLSAGEQGQILERIATVLASDELNESLEAGVREAALAAQRAARPVAPHVPPVTPGPRGAQVVSKGSADFPAREAHDRLASLGREMAAALEEAGPGARVVLTWQVVKEPAE